MGQHNSNQQIQQKYDVINVMEDGSAMLQDKKTHEEYLLRSICSNIEQQIICFATILKRRQKIKCTHLLDLIQIRKKEQKQVCSIVYKLYILIEYPFKSLKDEVDEKKLAGFTTNPTTGKRIFKQRFHEAELWSILYSCCSGLDSIYKSKMTHEALTSSQIYINRDGIIKISDPLLLGLEKNYIRILKKDLQKVFVSPEIMNFLDDCNFSFFDKQKSDVFTLGMIILEISLLRDINIYDPIKKQPNLQNIPNYLAELKQNYSDNFYSIVKSMVEIIAKLRPKFSSIMKSIQQENQVSSETRYSQTNNITTKNSFANYQFDQSHQNLVKTGKQPKEHKLTNYHPQSSGFQNFNGIVSSFSSTVKKQEPFIHQKLAYQQKDQRYYGNSQPPTVDFSPNSMKFMPKSMPAASYPNNPHQVFQKLQINHPTFRVSGQNQYMGHPYESRQQQQIESKLNSYKNNLMNQTNLMYSADIPEVQQILELNAKKYNNNKLITNNFRQNQANIPWQAHNFQAQNKNTESAITFVAHSNYDSQVGINFHQKFSAKKSNTPASPNNIKLNSPQKSPGGFKQNNDSTLIMNKQTMVRMPNNQPEQLNKQLNRQEGSYVSLQLNQGGHYSGYYQNGMKNGDGKLEFKDGGFYIGQWLNDQMHGFGRLHYENGEIAYEGQWLHDQFNGRGKVFNQRPQKILGSFNYYDFADLGNKWIFYEGEFHKDSKNGKGLIRLSNGEVFQGSFVYDTIQGDGIFYKSDGTTIRGIWKDNIFIDMI